MSYEPPGSWRLLPHRVYPTTTPPPPTTRIREMTGALLDGIFGTANSSRKPNDRKVRKSKLILHGPSPNLVDLFDYGAHD
ncbi:hypothetical protein M0804_000013 [Polistes exclamans]|nr:hypothetical protein M0804_000013 [Polistes exclamans]